MNRTITQSPMLRLGVRVLGAILLILVGVDHYYEYSVDQYSVLPTIGTLFLLNFISATVLGVFLLAPLGRLVHRFEPAAVQLAALSGASIAASSLAALLVSEHTKLFGFMESNYRPAIIVAIGLEAAAALALTGLFLIARGSRRGDGLDRPLRRGAAPTPGTT